MTSETPSRNFKANNVFDARMAKTERRANSTRSQFCVENWKVRLSYKRYIFHEHKLHFLAFWSKILIFLNVESSAGGLTNDPSRTAHRAVAIVYE